MTGSCCNNFLNMKMKKRLSYDDKLPRAEYNNHAGQLWLACEDGRDGWKPTV